MCRYAHTRENLASDSSLADKLELRPAPLAKLEDLLLVHDAE